MLALILALSFVKYFSLYKDWYNISVIRQTAYMVVNQITVNNISSLFGCTPAGRTSDYMTAPAKRLLSKSVGALCSGTGRARWGPTVGFPLLQHFSYFLFLAVESFIVVSSLYSFDFYVLGDIALMNSRGLNKWVVYTTTELRRGLWPRKIDLSPYPARPP